jgi:hypothetical protein
MLLMPLNLVVTDRLGRKNAREDGRRVSRKRKGKRRVHARRGAAGCTLGGIARNIFATLHPQKTPRGLSIIIDE